MKRLAPAARVSDDEDASDNSDEYALRVAGLTAQSGVRGERAAHALLAAHPTTEARVRAAVAALRAVPPTPPTLALALSPGDARDEARRHPTTARYQTLLGGAHAMLALTTRAVPPADDALQRALWQGAARPPWPTVGVSDALRTCWSIATVEQLMATQLGLTAVGVLVLGADTAAVVGEWPYEATPAGAAVAVVCRSAAAAVSLDAALALPADAASDAVRFVPLTALSKTTRAAPGWWYAHTALVDHVLVDAMAVSGWTPGAPPDA